MYAAFDTQLDRKVALKVLHRRDVDTEEGESRWRALMREARILGKLNHPNVVTLFDVGRFEEVSFVAMELVEGVDLRRWQHAEQRSTPAVLEVYRQAAAGLQAAHAAGIVHGDFKPANVLVGDDGRARVGDFGVARALAEPNPTQSSTTDDEGEVEHDTSATRFVGTPYFAAPEQHDGHVPSARSDVYAFVLALHDALAGSATFSGKTITALATQKEAGPPTPHPNVPSWLHPVIVRGLQPDAALRFESVSELLTALQPPVSRGALPWTLGTVGLGVGVAAVLGAAKAEPADPCEGAARHWDTQWSADRRQAVTTSLRAAELDATSVESAVGELSNYVEHWVVMQTESCQATHAGEQSPELLDLRTHCLHDRRRSFDASVRALLDSSPEVQRSQGPKLGLRLPDLAFCSNAAILRATPPDLNDPALAKTVDPVFDTLRDAEALERLGRYDDAFELAAQAQAAADASEMPALQAETLVIYGTLQAKLQGWDPAEASFVLAFDKALASDHDRLAIAAARNVLGALSPKRERLEDAKRWAEHARALVTRTGFRGELPAIELNLGHAMMSGEDTAGAKQAYERGLAALRDHPDRLNGRREPQLLRALGRIARSQGELEAALDYQMQAMEVGQSIAPAGAPTNGYDHHALALIYGKLGRHDDAAKELGTARDRFSASSGPTHHTTLSVEQSRALALHRAGHNEDAATLLRSTCTLMEKHDAESLPRCFSNLATIELELGNLERATTLAEDALDTQRRNHPDDVRSMAFRTLTVAEVRRKAGAEAEALKLFETAQRLAVDVLGADSPDIVAFELGLGRQQRELGDPELGLEALKRAQQAAGPDAASPSVRAEVAFELGRCMFAAGRTPAAHEVVAKARTLATSADDATLTAEIDAWQAAHSTG